MTGGRRDDTLRLGRQAARRLARRQGLSAPYALPVGFAALFALGTIAAALNGRLPAIGVLVVSAVIVTVMSAVSEVNAAVPLGVIGWLTVIGFSRPPYADLRPTGAIAADAAITMAACALAGAVAGWMFRYWQVQVTLESVDRQKERGIDLRRQLAGAALAVAGLPALTALLVAWREHLNLSDDLLIYLVAVVAVTVVGGFWPAVFAAVAASLLLNWYFTAPLHTFTIAEPKNLLALVLFVTVAVAVSSVVHLVPARPGADRARRRRHARRRT
jgi:two-component system sensor histidine kinase KdpD